MGYGKRQYWLFQLFGWGVFLLINVFFAFLFDKLETKFTSRLLIFIALGILLTHAMRWVIRRGNVLMKPLKSQILILICITFIFGGLLGLCETFAQLLMELEKRASTGGLQPTLFQRIIDNDFHSIIYVFMWNCIYFIYHYIEKSRRQEVDTFKLEALIKELELKTIKAHINPHFIFNSLNSIRALVDENPQRARTAITELSSILRSSMQADKSEAVAFEKELHIVKDYLALENMRFEDRLRVEYNIDEDTLDLPVPPMMLQTLVENAIKHGISRQIHGGVVRVVSELKNNFHELSVQNTGHLNGYTNNKEGFGLSSTTNRLSLLYGNKAKFEIRQATSSLVEARVSIPFDDAVIK
jgi:hypothetical protein